MRSPPLAYALFAYVSLLLHVIYLLISIFLIVVIQSTQLHKNCKFLLSVWGVGYMIQFICHLGISVLNTSISSLPINKFDPHGRTYLIDLSVASQLFCESLEIMIASERILSSINPAEYHLSGRNNKLLIPLIFLSIAFTSLLGWITEVGLHIIAAAGIFILEMCSLTMNSKAVKYCRRRKIELKGRFSLNASYQVKEAYQLAVSMQRAYLFTFITKNSFNGFIMASCYKADEIHMCVPLIFELPYFVLESVYGVGLTTTSVFLLCSLLSNHPKLKMKCTTLEQDVFEPPKYESVGAVYFDELRRIWN